MRKLALFMATVLTITSVPWPGGPIVPGVMTAQASQDKRAETLASDSDADMEEEEIEDEEPLASDSDADKPGEDELLESLDVDLMAENTYEVPGTNAVLTYEIGDDGCITITECNEDAKGALEVPAEIEGIDVTVIGPFAFSGNFDLTEIWLPDSITSIGSYAFLECDGLTKVRMPGGTTSIEEAAFRRCDKLKEIIWPDNITSTSIGDQVFYYCPSLTEVILPDGIISIGDYAFDLCMNLKKIVLPDSITSIGWYAFSTCSSLTEITLPNNITHISQGVFFSCGKLAEISIPDRVISIGSVAFAGCSRLQHVYYAGSETDWNRIAIEDDNEDLTNAMIHYNSSSGGFRLRKDNFNFINDPKDFIAADNMKAWKETKYSFENSAFAYKWHTLWGKDIGYYMSDEDYKKLTAGVSNTVKKRIREQRDSVWGGSCFGMAAVMALKYAEPDLLPIENIPGQSGDIHALTRPSDSKDVKSFINYHHLMYSYPYYYETLEKLYQSMGEDSYSGSVRRLISYIEDESFPVVACITTKKIAGAHSVLLLDIIGETNEYYKIKTYDPNKNDRFPIMYIYKEPIYNSSEIANEVKYSIQIAYSTSENAAGAESDYHLLYNYIPSADELNMRNYFYSGYRNVMSYDKPMIFSSDKNLTLTVGGEEWIIEGVALDDFKVQGPFLSPNAFDNMETPCEYFYILDDSAADMPLQIETSAINGVSDIEIIFEDWSTDVTATNTVDVAINNKKVNVSTSESSSIAVAYTENASDEVWPWETVVAGVEKSTGLTVEKVSDGLALSGDNLYNSTIDGILGEKIDENTLETLSNTIQLKTEQGDLVIKEVAPEEPDPEEPDSEEPDSEEPDSEEPDSEEPDSEEPDSEEPDPEEPGPEEPESEEPEKPVTPPDDSGNSGGGSSSGGSSSVAGPGSSSGTVSTDPKKGKVNSITGIVAGEAAGYSRWIQDTHGWKLLYADGTYAAGAMLQDMLGQQYEQISWELINGAWFAFGADQYLKTGFVYDYALAGWFYIDVNAGMKTGWVQIDQLWYYFNTVSDGTRGKMFCSRKSPDGYYLKEDGSWDGNLPS